MIKTLIAKCQQLFEPLYPEPTLFDRLDVELTTNCTLKCFGCARTMADSRDQGWNAGHLDWSALHRFLLSHPGLKELVFCGAYGDPIYHPQFIEIIRTLNQEFPQLLVAVDTNGSHRKQDWWEELGQACSTRNFFSFSIDGLQDSNAVYRENSSWDSLMTGVKTLRRLHPGDMRWKWILFRHNQHQVVEGYRLSLELGFNMFKVIDSVRHNEVSAPTMDIDQIRNDLQKEKGQAQVL